MMGDRAVNTWRYEFRPSDDGGTDATESFDLGDNLFTKIWRPLADSCGSVATGVTCSAPSSG